MLDQLFSELIKCFIIVGKAYLTITICIILLVWLIAVISNNIDKKKEK
jgi:hypothetical protein